MIKKIVSIIFVCVLAICIFGCASSGSNYEKWSQKYIELSKDLSKRMEAYWETEDKEKTLYVSDNPINIEDGHTIEELRKWSRKGCKGFVIYEYTQDVKNEFNAFELIKNDFVREFEGKFVARLHYSDMDNYVPFSNEYLYRRNIEDAYILKNGDKCTITLAAEYSSERADRAHAAIYIDFYK